MISTPGDAIRDAAKQLLVPLRRSSPTVADAVLRTAQQGAVRRSRAVKGKSVSIVRRTGVR